MRVLKIGRVALLAALLCGTTAMAAPKSLHFDRTLKVPATLPGLIKVRAEKGCYEDYFDRICVPRCHNKKHPMTDQQIYSCMEDCVEEAGIACNPPEQ